MTSCKINQEEVGKARLTVRKQLLSINNGMDLPDPLHRHILSTNKKSHCSISKNLNNLSKRLNIFII